MKEREALKLARDLLKKLDKDLIIETWQLAKTLGAIDEALAQPEQEKHFAKIFALMKSENEPCSEVLALGQMMKDWLQHQVSDNGSCVDTGKGFSEYDLWVMCEGKELFITIKEKGPTK